MQLHFGVQFITSQRKFAEKGTLVLAELALQLLSDQGLQGTYRLFLLLIIAPRHFEKTAAVLLALKRRMLVSFTLWYGGPHTSE